MKSEAKVLNNHFSFSNWELMRSGQPGVPNEDKWLASSDGAALEKGMEA